MPTLSQLEYIIAVNKNKHFGRAAAECHVSQPSLSAQIQRAEEELNLVIFDRSKKPILVTEQGRLVVEQAKRVLREHRRLYGIADQSEGLWGDFHLGVIPTLSPYLIPLFVESFSKNHPKVNLTVGEYKTEDIISMLHEDRLDGALLVTPLHDNQIIERSLFFEPFYLFVSENHNLAKRKVIRDADLDVESVWLLNEGHCFRDQVIRVCSLKKDRSQVINNVSFESGSLETLKNLIRKGRGYTLLPYLATLDLATKEKTKHLRKFTRPIPTREVSLVHSRSFLKEGILSAIETEVLESIPSELQSLKKGNVEVIEF